MAHDTHENVQALLADVRSWTPIVVEANGEEFPVTGLRIEHDEDGVQTKAVLETTTDNPTTPSHLAVVASE